MSSKRTKPPKGRRLRDPAASGSSTHHQPPCSSQHQPQPASGSSTHHQPPSSQHRPKPAAKGAASSTHHKPWPSKGATSSSHFQPRGPKVAARTTYTKEDLVALTQKSTTDIISEISNDLKKFQCTLEKTDICKRSFEAVITLLMKVCEGLSLEGDTRSDAIMIIGEVSSERCSQFQSQMKIYIWGQMGQDAEKNLNFMCNFFQLLMEKLSYASLRILPVTELKEAIISLAECGVKFSNKDELVFKAQELLDFYNEMKEQQVVSVIKSSSTSSSAKRSWDNSEYQSIQILPKWEEIENPKPPYQLRPNIVDGGYEDWMHYYDVQFRLLREDFISPLRKGISDFKKGKTGRDVRNLRIYRDVCIKEFKFTRAGLCHRIRFNAVPFRNYRWDHSKRLIFGSLLCLSPDNFTEKVLFATVTESNPQGLANGYLDVMFSECSGLLTHKNSHTKFTMVESLAYFEASRHILRSLQDAGKQCNAMPFTSYLILNSSEKVNPPRYLVTGPNASVYDLQFIIKHDDPRYEVPQQFKKVAVTNFSQWPTIEMTELDSSQLKALKMALTQEISVIQGPPGTGKTYIGLKIMQALLKNRHIWNPASLELKTKCRVNSRFTTEPNLSSPILVMCFTNHALDQFLEGILQMHENQELRLIRIGGRSKNEMIDNCNLNKYKRSLKNIPKEEFIEMKERFAEVEEEGRKLHEEMWRYEEPQKFIPFSEIKCVIEDHHLDSLLDLAETKEEMELAMEIWLGLYDVVEYYEESFSDQKTTDTKNENVKASSSSSDENSSDESEGGTSDEEQNGDSYLIQEDEDTIDVTGNAFFEEDARMIDGMAEMFEELKFSNYDPPPTEGTSGYESLERPNLRRVTRVVKCPKQYKLKKEIMKSSEMTTKEVRRLRRGVHHLELPDRFRLYKYWHSKYKAHLVQNLEDKFADYNDLCNKASKANHETDKYALETADVIGMTTTGAAKYQHILHLVKPKIVIVEEAAEVLESHIVSALNAGTQHLILIGDHKQLRPNPNEYDLVMKYKFDISLFERLVKNGFPHATLEIQHRMRPEISDIVRHHIYDNLLQDHDSVTNYPNVNGVASNLFFISHDQLERPSDLSHSNEHEAKFLVSFCSYLLEQNYSPSQITILVAYTGQLLLMKRMMPREKFQGVRLTTVDNFQGEENDIILLSVVRSNKEGSVGFLSTENRVCVALSRARHGLYCIGNFEMLRRKARIWERVIADMERRGKLGNHLTICCGKPKHRDTSQFKVKLPEDFAKGRCQKPCEDRLPCGHACRLKCHTKDPEHKKYRCLEVCGKECPEGHPCTHNCYLPCECNVIVTKTMPNCGHEKKMFCFQNPILVPCDVIVMKKLPNCDHSKEMLCHEDASAVLCQEKCTKVIPKCGHSKELPCYKDPSRARCLEMVTKVIPKCGHSMELPCHTDPSRAHCLEMVTKVMPKCDHLQEMYCSAYPELEKCKSACEKKCPEGHPCNLLCHQRCEPCKVTSTVTLPDCGHEIKKLCHQEVSQLKCKFPCNRKCKLGHPCPLLCHQMCKPCPQVSLVELPLCGHKKKKKCYQEIDDLKCKAPCDKKCESGHVCRFKCHNHYSKQGEENVYIGCGDCKILINKTLKCGHSRLAHCCTDSSTISCTDACSKKLDCGHNCPLQCSAPCNTAMCYQTVEILLPECKHTAKVPCHEQWKNIKCKMPCQRKLPCGHKCRAKCGELCTVQCQEANVTMTCEQGHTLVRKCFETLDKFPCDKKCKRKLSCGHQCQKLCSQPCETNCKKLVTKAYPCGHRHRINCSTPIEEQPCDMICKAPLACGHSCRGFCSECHSTHIHKPCDCYVRQQHFCGEEIRMRCRSLRDCHLRREDAPGTRHQRREGLIRQLLHCMHQEVTYSCKDEPHCCRKPCQWKCRHLGCTKLCHEECNRPPCNQKCHELLSCGEHECVGLCGEPCIDTCPFCETEDFMSKLMSSGEFSTKEVYIQLLCGDIFTVRDMDQHVRKHESEGIVGPLQCPECFSLLSCSYRYGNSMKQSLRHANDLRTHVKRCMEECLPTEKKDELCKIFRFISSNCSEAQLEANQRVLSQPLKCIQTMKEKLRNYSLRVSHEIGFLSFLLAKVFGFAVSDSRSICDYDCMMKTLLPIINKGGFLSFQMILDLSSELYKLCIQAKLSACQRIFPANKLKEKDDFLEKWGQPFSRLQKQDFFPFSQLLDGLLQQHHIFTFESTEEFVGSVERFYPVILNGSWRKCASDHFFCIPACEPESLTMKCPQCTCTRISMGGSYVDFIVLNLAKKPKTVRTNLAKEREKFLADMQKNKAKKESGGSASAAPKKKRKKKKKKKM